MAMENQGLKINKIDELTSKLHNSIFSGKNLLVETDVGRRGL